MVGVDEASPSLAGEAARLRARGVRTKRSWPPGCGRFPTRPPLAPEVTGDGEKRAEGRADEEVTLVDIPPTAQNITQHEQKQDKMEMPTSPVAVSPAEQNDSLPVRQGRYKAEEAVALAVVSSVECNSILQHLVPQQALEQVKEKDKGENSEVRLFNSTDKTSLDGQEGNETVQIATTVVGVPESKIIGASSYAHSGSDGAGLLVVAEGHGGSGHVVRYEAVGDAYGTEIGNRLSGDELERKVDGEEGSRKRWLTSALNPLPKRRVVSAVPVRRFPPGCGRAAVTTEGSEVSEVSTTHSFLPVGERRAVTTDDNGILEVSPVRTFPAGCGRAAVPNDGIAVLQVLPIRAYPPGCGRAAVTTIGSRDKEMMQLGATLISNGDASVTKALAAIPDSDCAANEKVEGKRVVEKGSTKEYNKIQEFWVASDASQVDIVSKVASSKLGNDETINDNEDSYQEDDDNSRALVVYGENTKKMEFNVNLPPLVPSSSHHEQSGDSDVDDRRKVKKLLQKFQGACRKLMQVEEQRLRNIKRIDLEAISVIKKDPMYTKLGAIVGNVPGVEIGDEFHFRVELSLVGLHRPYQGGIDTNKVNGILVALSIVASGGYPDELSSSDELIYTGSGGKSSGKKGAEDQKLKRGNLALKNCIETKTPVRVIHGFRGHSKGEVAHSKGKQVSTFIYDGLYNVVAYWQEGPKGSMVFKYKLQRIPEQPQLAHHVVKMVKKSKVREGLILPDISHGSERIPICVINTIDGLRTAPFNYVTKIIYPRWYKKEPPTGCDCTNGCSNSVKCACAVKNGGGIPYNFNGAIVEEKPLIFECGPSCRCPPTCHNRVSQHGVKIPLEIFKTGHKGWGVRSLGSISSGSFICEYAGELLEDKEAEERENDEYLFDIGSNYQDKERWKGLNPIPALESFASSSETMECFTLDAAECGNVGRFINHSCSPNLYAQNVLWDHDDVQKPHVMLFAVENIPPLQELTYHYNYKIGQVRDKNGDEKVKHCYCGSSECCGRLY